MNGLLTVSTADLADLVAPLRPGADRAVDAFALGAWSAVVEPGDVVGGLARRVLGPAVALRLVLESLDRRDAVTEPSLLGSALRNEGVDPAEVDDRRIARALSRWAPRTTDTRILSSFRAATALGLRLVVPGDDGWPPAFDDLGDHAPAALWLRGAAELPEVTSAVAVVGCRASTAYGEQVAADLGSALADRDFCIVSGGAYGIDGMAHRAALAADAPTVAVMAGGVDRFYPTGHDALLRAVVERGLLVSESPCGSTPSKWRFLQRNRVIAALSAVSVVVEAGRRSGALNTAAHAQARRRRTRTGHVAVVGRLPCAHPLGTRGLRHDGRRRRRTDPRAEPARRGRLSRSRRPRARPPARCSEHEGRPGHRRGFHRQRPVDGPDAGAPRRDGGRGPRDTGALGMAPVASAGMTRGDAMTEGSRHDLSAAARHPMVPQRGTERIPGDRAVVSPASSRQDPP